MQKHTILIVDDDPDILEVTTLYLTNAGYDVHTAACSTDALAILNLLNFHLIILDLMLPDLSGTALCQKIRQTTFCPIIFISCNDTEEDIIKALQVGGDDYIRKPLNFKELIARVNSNLRRVWYDNASGYAQSKKLLIGDLTIDIERHLVVMKNRKINLSPIEFDILVFMASNCNRILSYVEIYEQIWKSKSIGDTRTVMVHVSNLRKKIHISGTAANIQTYKKIGYMFSAGT